MFGFFGNKKKSGATLTLSTNTESPHSRTTSSTFVSEQFSSTAYSRKQVMEKTSTITSFSPTTNATRLRNIRNGDMELDFTEIKIDALPLFPSPFDEQRRFNIKSPQNSRNLSSSVNKAALPVTTKEKMQHTPTTLSKRESVPFSTSNETLRHKFEIKVKKNGKLYDDPGDSKVPIYSTHSKYRGQLLLINNMEFLSLKQYRKGAELDEIHLVKLFKQLGFKIVQYRNLGKKEMESKVVAFRNNSYLKKVDVGAIIIMSHGTGGESNDSTEVACTDGQRLHTHWIINQFDNELCPNLKGKPKIFIFQCCRGSQTDIQHDAVPCGLPRRLSDILIAYSTIPGWLGFVSHRDPNTGTWYIQAICKIFMNHACDTDVENLLKMVDYALSKLVTEFGSRQTSSFENRGFKTCYFHP